MSNDAFRYAFELPGGRNPPGTMDRFREDLRAYFVARGLDYGMGALGGDFRCYGDVRGRGRSLTEADREELAGWVRRQRVRCTAKVGELEPAGGLNLMAPMAGMVFEVNNPNDEGREQATG